MVVMQLQVMSRRSSRKMMSNITRILMEVEMINMRVKNKMLKMVRKMQKR